MYVKKLLKGFTLIELLIVISIIGVLAALLMTNFASARSRARDARAKSELNSVKTALSLYQNIYGTYPVNANNNGLTLDGCGPTGTSTCPYTGSSCTASFAAGGTGCSTVFMQSMTNSGGSNFFFRYYTCSSGADYRLKITLENASDSEISASQTRCPWNACSGANGPLVSNSYGANDYIVCP